MGSEAWPAQGGIAQNFGKGPVAISVATLCLGGIIAVIVSLLQGNWNFAAGLMWWLYMLGASFLGAAIGLIFAVPRARAEYAAESSERYAPNSNLEQISDWLTKILVGAGLVELKSLPGGLAAIGAFLGKDLAVANPTAFALSAIVYGTGAGFGIGYLWTRLKLRVLLESSDRDAAEIARRTQAVTANLKKTVTKEPGARPESEADLKKAARSAVEKTARADPGEFPPILWVDDEPKNNAGVVSALASLGIRVEQATSTQEGLAKAAELEYGLVISDLGRPEGGAINPVAGMDLIKQLRAEGSDVPFIIFSTWRALELKADLMRAGALLVTNRTAEVFDRAVSIVTRGS